MKIVQILPSMQSGGVERGTLEIAEYITQKGSESFIISNGGNMVSPLNKIYGEHIKCNVQSKNPIKILINSFRLARILKKIQPDIVHIRSRIPALMLAISSLFYKKYKVISTFHGMYSHKSKIKKYYNSFMLKADYVIAPSDFINIHLQKTYNYQKAITIHRGINSINRQDIKSADIASNSIIIVGRISPIKGHKMAMDALAILADEIEYSLIFIGDYKDNEKYFHELQSHSEQLEVKFTHIQHSSDIYPYYKAAKLVLFPSQKPESFGRIVIEAQMIGTIIAATAIGGATETIENNKTGFTFDKNAKSCAETIKKIFTMSESDKDIITKQAKENVENNFTLDNMRRKTWGIYEKSQTDLLGSN